MTVDRPAHPGRRSATVGGTPAEAAEGLSDRAVWAPAAVIVVIVLLEMVTGAHAVLLALVVIAPLVASSLLGAAATAGYAAAALVVGAALGVVSGQYAPEHLSDQLVRLATIAAGGALAVVAARARVAREARLARVLEIAAVAQRALLPPVPDRLGSLNLAASYDSAQEEAHIGGDAYAAVPSPFGARLLLADARGHGLDAVQLAATILGAFRERAAERDDLGDLVRDLDRAVARAGAEEDFATAVVAEIADGTLRIAVAGHASPLLIRAGASVPLDPPHQALPLGWGVDPEPFTVPLLAGDRVLLYTDGATDARRPRDGSFFPLERLAVDCLADDSLQAGLMRLRAALARWTQGPATDDVTFLTVEYAPTDGEPAAGREQQHPAGGHRPDAS